MQSRIFLVLIMAISLDIPFSRPFDTYGTPPESVVALSGYQGNIPIAWSRVVSDSLVGYDIYKSNSENGSYYRIGNRIVNTYFKDENVVNGITYFYKIKSIYQNSQSGFSQATSAMAAVKGYEIFSEYSISSPVLDGQINSGEWPSSKGINMTFPGSSNTVTLYVMNNESTVYIAVDDQANLTLNPNDGIGLFFDRDMDREWSNDTNAEGLFQIYWDGGTAKNQFIPFHGKWPNALSTEPAIVVSAVQQSMSTKSGHIQIEMSIDLQSSPLRYLPFSAFGFLIYSYESSTGQFTGLWPQETVNKLGTLVQGYGWAHAPFSYGNLKLALSAPPHFWADLDQDNDVDIRDVQLVASKWNKNSLDQDYDVLYDINSDGYIDIFDIQSVAYWWNKPLPKTKMNKSFTSVYQNQSSVKLELSPSSTVLQVAKQCTLQVIVNDVNNLGSFQFDANYNTLFVNGVSAKIDSFLTSTNRNVMTFGPDIDNTSPSGRLTFGAVTFGDSEGSSGTGILANIIFKAQSIGTSKVNLNNLILTDISGSLLSYEAPNEATISVQTGPTIEVVAPNGGENWAVNSEQVITWSSTNIDNIRIEYSIDGGLSWIQIAASTNANDLQYKWTIPNTISNQCVIKLTDINDISFYDISDANFGIVSPTDVNESNVNTIPIKFSLQQNYPNPFNPTTTIRFGIEVNSNVKITILNTIGEEVAVVLNEEKEAGYHQVEFNVSSLPSGVYIYKMKAGEYVETRKMVLLK